MERDDEDLLLHRLLRIVYDDLQADARGHHRHEAPKRFMSVAGMEGSRSRVLAVCQQHFADTDFVSFVDEQWLPQFRPLLS